MAVWECGRTGVWAYGGVEREIDPKGNGGPPAIQQAEPTECALVRLGHIKKYTIHLDCMSKEFSRFDALCEAYPKVFPKTDPWSQRLIVLYGEQQEEKDRIIVWTTPDRHCRNGYGKRRE